MSARLLASEMRGAPQILYVRQVVLDAFKEWQTCEDKSKEEKVGRGQ